MLELPISLANNHNLLDRRHVGCNGMLVRLITLHVAGSLAVIKKGADWATLSATPVDSIAVSVGNKSLRIVELQTDSFSSELTPAGTSEGTHKTIFLVHKRSLLL